MKTSVGPGKLLAAALGLVFIFSALGAVSVMGSSSPVYPDMNGMVYEPVFNDTFDDGILDGWIMTSWNPSGVLELSSAQSITPPYSFHAQSDPGTNTGPWIAHTIGSEHYAVLLSADIYLPPKSQAFDQFTLLRGSLLQSDGRQAYNLNLMLDDDNYDLDIIEYVWVNGIIERHEVSMNAYHFSPSWHSLELEIINDSCRVIIDGLVVSDFPRAANEPVNCIYLGDTKGSSGGWGEAYWDNIEAWSIGQAPEQPAAVDISVHGDDITITPGEPQEGDISQITATVQGDMTTYNQSINRNDIFSDDFNDGTIDKWSPSGWNPAGVMEVSDAVSNSPPFSLHMQSDPAVNTGPWVAKFLDNEYERIVGETWIYLPEKAQEYEYLDFIRLGSTKDGFVWSGGDILTDYNLMVRLDDDDYSVDVKEVILGQDGSMHFYIRGADIYELTPLSWHHISLEIDGQNFILSIDGSPVLTNTRFGSEPIDFVFLGDPGGQGGGGGDAYWDDVHVWTWEEHQEAEHQGLDATCTVSFYLDSISESNLIDRQYDVFVPADGTATVSANWVAVSGSHSVIVDVTDVDPPDSDLSNNVASTQISVSDPVPPNQPPVADAGADQTIDLGLEAAFDGSASYDPDGTIVAYDWDFGDGTTGAGISSTHTYQDAGNYTVTLTVTDDDGASDSDTCIVTVTAPPPPEPAHLIIDKIKTAGPDVVETHTKYGWVLRITVVNDGGADALDVVVHDVLPAELELVAHSATAGTLTAEQNGQGRMGSTSLTWDIGSLAAGEAAILDLTISTRCNPAGQQEFTSPGNYSLNDGAWVTYTDALDGCCMEAGPTPPITVTVIEVEEEDEEENIVLPPEDAGSVPAPEANREMPERSLGNLVVPPPEEEAYPGSSLADASSIASSTYFMPAVLLATVIAALASLALLYRWRAGAAGMSVRDLDMMLLRGDITEEEYLKLRPR